MRNEVAGLARLQGFTRGDKRHEHGIASIGLEGGTSTDDQGGEEGHHRLVGRHGLRVV
ncbi:hypothetical protein BOSEA31B_14566 [Hyphomicrobiales bacterium]|nr:hypothetical protein BOSEA31B_14566 [Hyphomicrobiales bacterium]CAH1701061.1 hypothetical protein BOSEA1005_20760 [Hyphomicrobiales bacterium]CAI0344120.1 hypothetical protein BO1005MUT1_310149 [Hyphomicrobiales bacterium]